MMDRKRIMTALALTAEVTSWRLSAEALTLMAEELEEFTEAEITVALKRVRREVSGRFALTDVLDRIPNQPPSEDAAWNLAIGSRLWDESLTVILPRAVFASFPFALWDSGDRIGARMAFKASYTSAKERYGREVQVSIGTDAPGRQTPITEAVEQGLIAPELAARLLDNTTHPRAQIEGQTSHQLIALAGRKAG